jgi:hypothetical protein
VSLNRSSEKNLKKFLRCSIAIAAIAIAAPAFADGGNIFLTGHDADLHMYYGSASAKAALTSELNFVRNGSSLPVLSFDAGVQLTSDLATLGIAYVNFDPGSSLYNASTFDAKLYSAIAVASHQDCGGCDNTTAGLAKLATFASSIASFFNAGGGILGLAGADDAAAYAYVPQAAANAGGNPPSTGFVETPAGLAVGLVAENGDPTHNYFGTPGVGGLSSAYQVAEVNSGSNESLFVKGGTISCVGDACGIVTSVPEPETYALMLMGLGVVGFVGRRRRA